MKSARYYLSYGLRKFWFISAFVLVTFAVLLSALRLVVPHLDQYRYVIEDYISDTYGADLAIGNIEAAWTGNGPMVVLNEISLNTGAQAPVTLSIDETRVELDFWSSLLNRQIHSRHFNLNGLRLTVDGDALTTSGDDYPVIDALKELFLDQLQQFSVTSSEVVLTRQGQTQRISLEQLSWRNRGERHQGVGMLRVDELTRNSAEFVLDLHGDREALTGTFYASAKALDISPWLAQVGGASSLSAARINLSLWANIRPEGIGNVQARLGDSQLQWQNDDHQLQLSQADFRAQPAGRQWRFALDDVTLKAQEGKSPLVLALSGVYDPVEGTRLQSSNIPIGSLHQLLQHAGVTQNALQMDGKVRQLALHWHADALSAHVEVSDLAVKSASRWPGIEGLNASLFWYNDTGFIEVSGQSGVIDAEQSMGLSIPYQQLKLELFAEQHERDHWRITAPQLHLSSDTMEVKQALQFDTASQQLAIVSRLRDFSTDAAKQWFPENLMGKDTSAYLKRALQAGEVKQARLLWQGIPSNFPFSEQDGVFQAGFDLNKATFKFAPDWPAVTELDAQVLFENAGLTINGRSGKLRGVATQNVQGRIDSLDENAVLELAITSTADALAVEDVMDNSTLVKSVGAVLKELRIEGDLTANVSLSIPLSGGDPTASGRVVFNNNPLWIDSLNQAVTKLSGELTFEDDQIQAKQLTARLWQQPLTIGLDGRQTDSGYQTDIQLQGVWSPNALLTQSNPALAARFHGEVDWQGELSLTLPESGYVYALSLTADLDDFAARLPAPLSSTLTQDDKLTAEVSGNELVSELNINLNDNVTFSGLLPHKEMQFSRAHLALGPTDFVGMGSGFSVSANLPKVNLVQWQQAVSDLTAFESSSDNTVLAEPERIFLTADQLEMAGVVLQQADVNIKYTDLAWLAEVSAKQSRAEVTLFHDWQAKGIEIRADYLRVPKWESDDNNYLSSDVVDIPPLRFYCGQCHYQDQLLGEIELRVSPTEDGVNIDKLDLQQGKTRLSLSGRWHTQDDQNVTAISGDFKTNDLGGLLKDFEVDSGIRDSGANVDFALQWQGAPHGLNLGTLSGEADWRLSDGYLSEVSDKGARLFSILSLDSLVRKLTLDFRDVFAQGFFYDQMQGSFDIAQGRVSTTDTVIDGAAGKMGLTGYTDLPSEELNYRIEFTPKITSSLPVILAWMANPATAIAAFAIDEVLESAKVISNIQYSLTGTLADPILKEMNRDSREVSIPAQQQPQSAPSVPDETTEEDSQQNG